VIAVRENTPCPVCSAVYTRGIILKSKPLIMKKLEMFRMERIQGGINGQSVADCISDAYANHGWTSVAAWIISAFYPATVAFIASACAGKNV
jgi:hypothetical protein